MGSLRTANTKHDRALAFAAKAATDARTTPATPARVMGRGIPQAQASARPKARVKAHARSKSKAS